MIIGETQNIKKLNDFCETFKEERVVKSGLDEFKSVTRSIIFSGENIQRSASFFNESTIREKIQFKDFLKIPKVNSLMKKINEINTELIDITKEGSASIDEILSAGDKMDVILRENHGRKLKEKMFIKVIDIKELESSHSYLANRLTDEMKKKLIKINSEIHEKIMGLINELDSILK